MEYKYQKNKRKDLYRLSLYFLLFFDLLCLGYAFFLFAKTSIPDEIHVTSGKTASITCDVPGKGSILGKNTSAKNINLNKTFHIVTKENVTGNYTLKSSLFGLIELKETSVKVVSPKKVIPCGVPVGIYVKTKGLLVLDTQSIRGKDGKNYEPAKNKVKAGDYIRKVNGKTVNSKEEFRQTIMGSQGKKVTVELYRDEKKIHISLTPVMTEEGLYKLGIWLRDDTQGLGTITYIDGNKFGALGHGINDYDTGTQMNIGDGSLYEAKILSIQKGEKGNPGELIGQVKYGLGEYLGQIKENGDRGIYGTLQCDAKKLTNMEPMEVAYKQEVKEGKASLRIQLNGKLKDYEIKILKVDGSDRNKKQGILFEITDKELLSLTGGVVQGMSGSPVLQNGRIVGAVTHVLVNDPTRGYGIFIENMLEH